MFPSAGGLSSVPPGAVQVRCPWPSLVVTAGTGSGTQGGGCGYAVEILP